LSTMAAALQKEMKDSMAVVAITTRGRPVLGVALSGCGTLLVDMSV
jgi:hypothetical protein